MISISCSLNQTLEGLIKLSSFEQFTYGDQFTLADIAAILNLPIARSVGKMFLGKDLLSEVPGLDAYCMRMEERRLVKKIRADAAVYHPNFMVHLKACCGIFSASFFLISSSHRAFTVNIVSVALTLNAQYEYG
ncbi:MAG: glutathione S-transferase [Oceanicoccus sp.]